MRIMVTGAAGFIGSTLVDRLLENDHEVVAVDNFDDYYAGKMRYLERHLRNPRFRLFRTDILNIEELRRLMRGIQIVFHMAAQPGVRASVRDPMKSHRVNVRGTLNVLIAAKENGVARVINSSSSSVYGDPSVLPVDEGCPPSPVSPYAASKLSAEHYCRVFSELYGLETVSLRYFTVYGPRQRPDMAIRIFIERMAHGLPPQIFGDGEQMRDFTYIDDVIRALLLCIEGDLPVGGVLNICSSRSISLNKIVSILQEIMHREDLVPEYLPPQPGDVRNTWGSYSRAFDLLGWRPEIKIEEGLRLSVEWCLRNEKNLPVQESGPV